MHRNIHGQKSDHALLACTWTWRLRTEKSTSTKDFSCLAQATSATKEKFNEAVKSKLDQLQYDSAVDSATGMYTKMCDAINYAVETVLPTVIRKKGIKR